MWSTLFIRAPGLEPGDHRRQHGLDRPAPDPRRPARHRGALDDRRRARSCDADDGSAGQRRRATRCTSASPTAGSTSPTPSSRSTAPTNLRPPPGGRPPTVLRRRPRGLALPGHTRRATSTTPGSTTSTVGAAARRRPPRSRASTTSLDGGDDVLRAYVGGGLDAATVSDEGAWVVAAVDGVVSGMSPLFLEERHDRGFALLLDAEPGPARRHRTSSSTCSWTGRAPAPIALRGASDRRRPSRRAGGRPTSSRSAAWPSPNPCSAVLGDNPTFFVAHDAGPGAGRSSVSALAVARGPGRAHRRRAARRLVAAHVGLAACHLVIVGAPRPAWSPPPSLDDLVGTVLDDLPLVSGPLTLVARRGAAYALRPGLRPPRHACGRPSRPCVVAPSSSSACSPSPPPPTTSSSRRRSPRPTSTVAGRAARRSSWSCSTSCPLASVLTADGDDHRRRPLPEPGPAGRRRHLVPERHLGRGLHPRGRPRHPHRRAGARRQPAADRQRPPRHPLHPAGRGLRHRGLRAAHRLCAPRRSASDVDRRPTGRRRRRPARGPGRRGRPRHPAGGCWRAGCRPSTTPGPTSATIRSPSTWRPSGWPTTAHAFVDDARRLRPGRSVPGRRSAGIQAQPAPQLTFIHTVFPHVPWSYHADGSPYPDPGNPGLERQRVDDELGRRPRPAAPPAPGRVRRPAPR